MYIKDLEPYQTYRIYSINFTNSSNPGRIFLDKRLNHGRLVRHSFVVRV